MSEEYIGMEWSQDILERLQMIAYEETVREPFRKYFRTTATFLSALLMGSSDDNFLLPPYRYLDADYLVRELSPYGSRFSVLSMELYRLIPAIHEGRIEHVKATLYTFIELYCMFEEDYLPENKDGVRCLPDPQRVQDVLYAYAYDYSELFLTEQLDQIFGNKKNMYSVSFLFPIENSTFDTIQLPEEIASGHQYDLTLVLGERIVSRLLEELKQYLLENKITKTEGERLLVILKRSDALTSDQTRLTKHQKKVLLIFGKETERLVQELPG